MSINFFPFPNEEYNNYYPNDVIYEEDEVILTFHLGVKNEYINKIFANKENYENILKKMLMLENSGVNISIRKKENKLFLDCKEKGYLKNNEIFMLCFLFNNLQILMSFQNNLTFEKLREMNFEEFSRLLGSFDLSLHAGLKNLESLQTLFEQLNDEDKKDGINILYLAKVIKANNAEFKWDVSFGELFESLKKRR